METIIICVFAILALAIVKIFIDMSSTKKTMSKAKHHFNYEYETKPIMTKSEINFFQTLKTLESNGLHVFPQINLASIINKKGKYTYQNELFRNIDFGIFDESYNPKFLIELNDKSHERKDRKERDEKVKAICNNAGIDLITINTNNPDIEIIKSYITKNSTEYSNKIKYPAIN